MRYERWKRYAVAALVLGMWLARLPAAEAQGGPPGTTNAVNEASRLHEEAVALHKEGKYAAAIQPAQRSLAILEKALGPSHPDVAASLNNLAEIHRKLGEYDRAEPLYLRSLAIKEKALGPDHPGVAISLNNLAAFYKVKGEHGRAEPLYERALAIREKALGPDHPDVAASLNNLGLLYVTQGRYDRAAPLYARALSIKEKTLGPDHPGVATSLNNLADLYDVKGQYDRAEPLYERALAIREKAQGPDHPDVASSLNNLATTYQRRAAHARAEPLYLRAIAIREKVLGPDHPAVATSLNNLATLYKEMGEHVRAEPLYLRAISTKEKELGPNHPDLSTFLDNLAGLYDWRGEYDRAEPLYRRALSIKEKALGTEHPDIVAPLNNLALLLETKGEYGRAEPLYQRALTLAESALGPNHPTVATCLGNLAGLHHRKGEHDVAERLYERSLGIREKALGPDHPSVAAGLNNLAFLLQTKGEYDRAERLYHRSLAIKEKAFSPNHPSVAASLNNLALLHQMKGEYTLAEPLFLRSLGIRESALGGDHPEVASSLNNLSGVYWASGRLPEAIAVLARGQEVEEKTLARIIRPDAELQKRAYLATLTGQLDGAISLALVTRDASASRLASTTLLRRKGRALDATAGSVRALRTRLGAEEEKLFGELDGVRSRYVTLALRGPGGIELSDYRRALAALDAEIQQHEAAISRRSATFRAEQQAITLESVQSALPDAAALIEWAVYRPYNARAHAEQEKWGPARYVASVLAKRGDPVWIDLGDAQAIDAGVQAFRVALRRSADDQAPVLARALDARVMAPIRALLGNTRRLLLSPDGPLNLVPFAAFVGEDGRSLIERYNFTYLTSGRDLLRLTAAAPARGGPLILANPDLDAANGGAAPGTGRFLPLLHAEEEAAEVSRLFPGSTVLLRREATKRSLQAARGPRLLHIGTHGYFEPTICMTDPGKADEAQREALKNPLLHSGIALAGANGCASGQNEGLLTAFEAAGLDLYGTKLAVLSACQTGVGDAKAGDGVYGLRRALVLAGAETQVMSLWPVDGAATSELMKAYYERLAQGEGRSEAMRQVQLGMLHTPGREHPYYWAPFIVSGDDRTLEDRAVEPDLRVHPGGACACRVGGEVPEDQPAWFAVAVALGWMRRRARAGSVVRAAQERGLSAREGGERP